MNDEMIAVVFDTETTDQEPLVAQIVQLGVLQHMGEEVPDIIMNSLCDPGIPIPPGSSEVHRILDEHVELAPDVSIVVDTFLRYLKSIPFPVLVGHNINYYDVPVVAKVSEEIKAFPTIDTYMMSRRLYPELESHKLADVYVALGGDMDPEGAHDAVYDCVLNHFIFQKMLEKLNYTVEEFWQYSLIPTAFSIMPFGKHKGKKMEDVPTGYLTWCAKTFTDMDIDTQKTFNVYLGRETENETVN